MPDARRRYCQCCGNHSDAVGAISWNGNCINCAIALMEENNKQIAAGKGYAHKRRIRGYQRYLSKLLLDEQQVAE